MNMGNKSSKMKKIIIANNIFVVVQMVLLVLSVMLNFICDDVKVFLTVFIHVGLFVVFNIVVENGFAGFHRFGIENVSSD